MNATLLPFLAGGDVLPQVFAPSSNDWDSGSGSFNASGNELGDHTDGGNIQANTTNEGWRSLITLDGDFIIDWIQAETQTGGFGIYDIAEDATFDETERRGGLHLMTDSFWWGYDYGQTAVWHGGTSEGSFTAPLDGENLILRRVGSVITLENVTQATTLRQWTSGTSATMRFIVAASTDTNGRITDLKITDSSKIQRDGFYNESTSAISDWGDLIAGAVNYGRRITPTRTGKVIGVKLHMAAITASFNAKCQIYTDDGTSPATIIGLASDTVAIDSTGEKYFTLASKPDVTKGVSIWTVFSDVSLGGIGRATMTGLTQAGLPENQRGCGRNDTITSIIDNEVIPTIKMELVYETTREPTPDHEVIFQVQSNDTNGSTSFTDEGQEGRTVTPVDGAHHDNVQAKFGTTSIYCDGTDDEITLPDSADYSMASGQPFTWEFFIYPNGTPANNTHCAGQGTATAATYAWFARFNTGGTLTVGTSNGTTQRLITCTTDLSSAFHHVCLMHSGAELFLMIDGAEEGTSIVHTDAVQDVAYPFEFGGGNNSSSHIDAWFEGMRLSRTMRYDPAGFTPPTARFPSS